jgi:hypothetical protein
MVNEMTAMDLYEKHIKKIKRSGNNNYVGLCPFHDDTHQSLGFNEIGLYNCFTCGAKGNAISMAKHFNEDPRPFYDKPLINNGGTMVKNKTVTPKADLTDKAKEYWSNLGIKAEDDTYATMLLLGKDEKGVRTFPYFDEQDRVVGIKHHKSYWEGDGTLKWYGANQIHLFDEDEPIYICEGEPDTNRLNRTGANVLCSSGGAMSIPKPLPEFKKFGVIIVLDNDDAGRNGSLKCAQKIYDELGIICEIAKWRDGLPSGYDISDDMDWKEFELAIEQRYEFRPNPTNKTRKGYNLIPITEALKLDIPKPGMIVEDILNECGNTLLTATDNVGKSMMANQIACCIATGTDFLGYRVPKPRKVALVQHEMENGEQLDRLKKQTVSFNEMHPDLMTNNLSLHIIEPDENLLVTDQFEVIENTLINDPDIDVMVFDNIGQSTTVEMSKPDAIRNELKRLKAICRKYNVAFLLVAHHVKVDYDKVMDMKKEHIQGGKPVTDWADNVVQLQTSSINPSLVLFKITKIRSVHDKDGITTKLANQAVRFNQDKDLLFTNRLAIANWEAHFKATDKYEREMEYLRELARRDVFTTLEALNESATITPPISEATVKGRWLPKFCKYGWLEKVKHGHYKVSDEMKVMLNDPSLTGTQL